MVEFFYGLPIWLVTILILALLLGVGVENRFGDGRAFDLRSTVEETSVGA